MSEYRERKNNNGDEGIAEGGGSGGGTESVHQERQRVSPVRGPALIFILILAVIALIGPVVWVLSMFVPGLAYNAVWGLTSLIAVSIAVFTLYYLFKKSI